MARDVTHREPGERDVAMVFQSYALYPHMTVAENIGFPLKMVGIKPAEIDRSVAEAAGRVNIGHLLAAPAGASCRAASSSAWRLARAIVRRPNLFLLDEPLSNLDAKLRLETRLELPRCSAASASTTVYVTARPGRSDDARRPDRRVHGRPHRPGRHAAQVYARPRTMAVAGFVGTPQMNLLPGTWQAGTVTVAGHALPVAQVAAGRRDVVLGVRPSDLRLASSGLPAHIERIEDLGDSAIASLIVSPRCGPDAEAQDRSAARGGRRRQRLRGASRPKPPTCSTPRTASGSERRTTTRNECNGKEQAERRADPERRHGLFRPRLLRRRDRDAQPRPAGWRQGLRFSQFYNTARCSPSRASMMTGLHPHQTGVGILTYDLGPEGYAGNLNKRCGHHSAGAQGQRLQVLHERQVARRQQPDQADRHLAAAARLRRVLRHHSSAPAASTIPIR